MVKDKIAPQEAPLPTKSGFYSVTMEPIGFNIALSSLVGRSGKVRDILRFNPKDQSWALPAHRGGAMAGSGRNFRYSLTAGYGFVSSRLASRKQLKAEKIRMRELRGLELQPR